MEPRPQLEKSLKDNFEAVKSLLDSLNTELEVKNQSLEKEMADLMVGIQKHENEKSELREYINKLKACVLFLYHCFTTDSHFKVPDLKDTVCAENVNHNKNCINVLLVFSVG